jgi:hypothetical protein
MRILGLVVNQLIRYFWGYYENKEPSKIKIFRGFLNNNGITEGIPWRGMLKNW